MDSDLSTVQQIELSFENANWWINQLQQGQNLRKLFEKHLSYPLPDGLNLRQSLQLAVSLDEFTKQKSTQFVSQLAYPLFLFFFSFGMVYFFDQMILPTMALSLRPLVHLLLIVYSLVTVLMCLFFILFVFRQTCLGFWEHFRLFRLWQSCLFAKYMGLLLKAGLSTKEMLVFMCDIPYLKAKTKFIQKRLEQGQSWIEALSGLDAQLIALMKMGLDQPELVDLLGQYAQIKQNQLMRQLQHLIKKMQVGVYIGIGLIVILFYQILLVPLNMVQGL